VQQHESNDFRRTPENDNPPPRNNTTFWLGMVIYCLMALITVVLLNRWI